MKVLISDRFAMLATGLMSAVLTRSRFVGLAAWLPGLLLAGASVVTAAPVDFGRANDYYAARGTGPLQVVEQYHLGPCEQRLRERDYPRTLAECNFILKIFPNHPQALLLVSQACERWKSPLCRLDDVFQSAVAINPSAPETFVVQGIYLHRAHQYGKAIQAYQYALKLDPGSMNAHYNLALTYVETKQFDLANEHAQRAYELGATLPGLRNMLQSAGHWAPSTDQGATQSPATPPQASNRPAVPSAQGTK